LFQVTTQIQRGPESRPPQIANGDEKSADRVAKTANDASRHRSILSGTTEHQVDSPIIATATLDDPMLD
jgi:hypothetical protein